MGLGLGLPELVGLRDHVEDVRAGQDVVARHDRPARPPVRERVVEGGGGWWRVVEATEAAGLAAAAARVVVERVLLVAAAVTGLVATAGVAVSEGGGQAAGQAAGQGD